MAILTGAEGDDTLVGTADADIIDGLGGADAINGGDKADVIHGGDGNDVIDSGYRTSNVWVDSPFGARHFGDGGGNQIFGDAGDDTISGGANDLLDGGDGADALTAISAPPFDRPAQLGPVTLLGGAGDDKIQVEGYGATIDGGSGDDQVSIWATSSTQSAAVTLGTGADTLTLGATPNGSFFTTNGQVVVSDFGLDDTLAFTDFAAPNPTDLDPFAATSAGGGGKRIGQSGADVILTGGASGTVVLQNVDVAALTAANFNGHALGQIWTFGTAGDDVLTGGAGVDRLDGFTGDDVIIGGGGGDQLAGGGGVDTFRYLSATDSMTGAQDVLFDFTIGVDKIDLTALNATEVSVVRGDGVTFVFASAASGQFVLGINGAADLRDIDAGRGGYEIGSSSGFSSLYGGAYGDVLQSGGGGFVQGGGGGDVLIGGAGSETFYYLAAADSAAQGADAIHNFQTGVDQIAFAGFGVSAISLIRSGGSTFLFADTAGGAMQLSVVDADLNASDLSNVSSVPVYMQGDTGADTLIGGFAADVIEGGAGDDVIRGGAGGDTIQGGAGDDLIIGGAGGDKLYGQGGADTFKYVAASDSNNAGTDILYGFQSGVDKIDLSAVQPTEVSLIIEGADTFVFANTPDGAMRLTASGAWLNAGDIVTGGNLGFYMIGSDWHDILVGGAGGDVIQAGEGHDTIIGGAGGDALWGQAGMDTFKYLSAGDSTVAAPDSIFDFQSGVDKLDLTGVRTGASDVLGVYSTGGSTFVFVDLHGDGVMDMTIQMNGTPAIYGPDYIF